MIYVWIIMASAVFAVASSLLSMNAMNKDVRVYWQELISDVLGVVSAILFIGAAVGLWLSA